GYRWSITTGPFPMQFQWDRPFWPVGNNQRLALIVAQYATLTNGRNAPDPALSNDRAPSRAPLHRHHVGRVFLLDRDRRRGAVLGPRLHQLAPLGLQIGAAIAALDRVADRVRQGQLSDDAREAGALFGPRPEA